MNPTYRDTIPTHHGHLNRASAGRISGTQQFAACLSCLFVVALTGCSTFKTNDSLIEDRPSKSIFDHLPWSKNKDGPPEPYPNPVKLAATWTPDTLTQVGRVPTRGFGARVYFYDEKSRPVPVEGTLTVHAFAEATAKNNGIPNVKRYQFTPEQFTRHFSRSDLGASYSVWIPWDAVGGKQTRVSLVASFTTAEGKTIQGRSTTALLPGTKDSAAESLAQRFSPEYRQWQAASSGSKPSTSGLTTTTIHRNAPAARTSPEFSEPTPGIPSWNIATGKSTNSRNVAMKSSQVDDESDDVKPKYQTLPASSRTPSR